jgi:hypothetical protein
MSMSVLYEVTGGKFDVQNTSTVIAIVKIARTQMLLKDWHIAVTIKAIGFHVITLNIVSLIAIS